MSRATLKKWFLSTMDPAQFPPVPTDEAGQAAFLLDLAHVLSTLPEEKIEAAMGCLLGVLAGKVQPSTVADALNSEDSEKLVPMKRLLIGELAVDFLITGGNWDSCLPLLGRLLKIAGDLHLSDELAILYNYRGVVLYRLARYPEARTDLEKSLKFADEIDSDRRRARAGLNLGLVLQEMGLWEDAAEHYRTAMKLARDIGDERTLLSCYLNIGYIYIELKRYSDGRKALNKGIELAGKLGETVEGIRGTLNLGVLALDEGKNLEEAVRLFEKAIEEATKAEAHQLVSKARSNLALALLNLGRPKESLAQSELSLERAIADGDVESIWRTKANMARACWMSGDVPSADRYFWQAFYDFDNLRRGQVSDRERSEIQVKMRTLQSEYIEFSLENFGVEIAFARHAGSKSRSLTDVALRSRQVDTGLSKSDAEILEGIQNALQCRPGSLLVDYFIHDGHVSVFVADGESVSYIDTGYTEQDLEPALKEFRDEINLFIASKEYRDAQWGGEESDPAGLNDLWKMLIEPLKASMQDRQWLIIVPQGSLHGIPFQALIDNTGQYLIENYSVSYLPASEYLLYGKVNDKNRQGDIAILKGSAEGLASLDEELNGINEIFVETASVIEAKKVLESSGIDGLAALIKDAQIVHFAGHAEFDRTDPYSSALILDGDVRISVSDLESGRFDLSGVRLVTLAACETGMGKVVSGDEVIGLARPFLSAGAGQVLVSQWKVSDTAAMWLILDFYRELARGASAEEALRASMLTMLSKDRPHPYFFAPFQLLGPG